MVVTRSEKGHKHQDSLRRTRNLILDERLIVDNKPEFIRLLNKLYLPYPFKDGLQEVRDSQDTDVVSLVLVASHIDQAQSVLLV